MTVYPYRIREIGFTSSGETLLGIEVIATGQMIYRSAYQLFFQETWFTQFSPDNIRAIAGFALEDRWKREQKMMTELES